MDLGLRDRPVVVTGAGSNIGWAIALTFAAEGARLTPGGIDEDVTGQALSVSGGYSMVG